MSHERSMKCQVFVDPLYGSERYVTFEPEWVAEARDGQKGILFRPKRPVTFLTFVNGEQHTVQGHWAEKIAEAKAASPDSRHHEEQEDKPAVPTIVRGRPSTKTWG